MPPPSLGSRWKDSDPGWKSWVSPRRVLPFLKWATTFSSSMFPPSVRCASPGAGLLGSHHDEGSLPQRGLRHSRVFRLHVGPEEHAAEIDLLLPKERGGLQRIGGDHESQLAGPRRNDPHGQVDDALGCADRYRGTSRADPEVARVHTVGIAGARLSVERASGADQGAAAEPAAFGGGGAARQGTIRSAQLALGGRGAGHRHAAEQVLGPVITAKDASSLPKSPQASSGAVQSVF